MTKITQPKRGLPPLDLRVQDHYEDLLTVSDAARLSGFTKQFIYRLTKIILYATVYYVALHALSIVIYDRGSQNFQRTKIVHFARPHFLLQGC